MLFRKSILILYTASTFVFFLSSVHAVYDGNAPQILENIEVPFEKKPRKEEINPHFTGKYCDFCHAKKPEIDGEKYLKYGGDLIQLCSCHKYTAGTYIHPVFIKPSAEKIEKIPGDYPLVEGKLSCITCHDMYKQCQENPDLQYLLNSKKQRKHKIDIMFLRGDNLQKRTDICFKCHNESKYKMLDPHNQMDAKGKIIIDKCLYCHKQTPDVDTESFKDVGLIGDLKVLCRRCHGDFSRHPAGVDHFVVPSPKLYARMKIIEGEFGIVLPLDHEGKLTCATCHNPHERGVIPEAKSGSMGAGEQYRHRLPQKLCQSCHGY
jgi:hypothetical protein